MAIQKQLSFPKDRKRSKTGLFLAKESEWDEAKQKNRATTWSLDASATTILKSGTVKVYFPDKALADVGRVGNEDTKGFRRSNLNQ